MLFRSKARSDIEGLPGVGQYIANAIELFAFGRSRPLIDVNMARVLERCFGKRTLADIRYDARLQRLASLIVHGSDSARLNWAILDLSAIVCKVRVPNCVVCPLKANCLTSQTKIKKA